MFLIYHSIFQIKSMILYQDDIAKYLKKNHRMILLTECTLDINRNKHIAALHVSLFKPFFIAKFQHLSVLFYVYLVWIIATKKKS